MYYFSILILHFYASTHHLHHYQRTHIVDPKRNERKKQKFRICIFNDLLSINEDENYNKIIILQIMQRKSKKFSLSFRQKLLSNLSSGPIGDQCDLISHE